MTVKYTVYADIEAEDESKLHTSEDDCWHPSDHRDLATFGTLQEAEEFLGSLEDKP